ncbi:MAG: DUF2384 domain-containing protein [Phycisphaerales bacterium]|nr:DUF2384 domain-containing protein [Phycisphaerales bacterium]
MSTAQPRTRRKPPAARAAKRSSATARRAPLATKSTARATSLTTLELVQQVRRGLPFARLRELETAAALSREETSALISVPLRTITRREQEGRLHPDESDRVMRATRLVTLAIDLFDGKKPSAAAWLKRPQRALGGESPLQFATTDAGAREVEHLIGRLAHGVIA